jgi:hypothetical protein
MVNCGDKCGVVSNQFWPLRNNVFKLGHSLRSYEGRDLVRGASFCYLILQIGQERACGFAITYTLKERGPV